MTYVGGDVGAPQITACRARRRRLAAESGSALAPMNTAPAPDDQADARAGSGAVVGVAHSMILATVGRTESC
jgi:hypothetical protein